MGTREGNVPVETVVELGGGGVAAMRAAREEDAMVGAGGKGRYLSRILTLRCSITTTALMCMTFSEFDIHDSW